MTEAQAKDYNKKIVDANNNGIRFTWDYSTKLLLYSKCPMCKKIHAAVDPMLDKFDTKSGFVNRKCWQCLENMNPYKYKL